MFDVGFSEMVVIAIVALIVIGPEKLPKVARTLGLLAGRMQRYVSNIKSDIEREMQFEDLQKLQQEIKQGLTQTQSELHGAASNVKKEVAALERDIESSLLPQQVTDATTPSELDSLKLDDPKREQPTSAYPALDIHTPENQVETPAPIASNIGEPSIPALMQSLHNSESASLPQQDSKPTKPQ